MFAVVTVWLTVPTMLLASSPHIDCVCPNGSKKPFCLSAVLGDSACCCRGACCSSSGPQKEKQTGCCCCKNKRLRQMSESEPSTSEVGRVWTGAAHSSQPGVQQRGCEKSLAVTHAFIADKSHTAIFGSPLVTWIMIQVPSEFFGPALSSTTLSVPVTSSLPPPSDLVVVLCHFLI
jgi:hypothetical protein